MSRSWPHVTARLASLAAFAASATTALAACASHADVDDGISPQPQPTPGKWVTLDVAAIDITAADGALTLRGRPGSVAWAPNTIRVFDVDLPSKAATATVAADGSFVLTRSGALGDLLRLEAETEDGYVSASYDVRSPSAASGVTVGVEEPLPVCLRGFVGQMLPLPQTAPGATAQAQLTFSNLCGDPVTITSLAMHDGEAFSVSGATLPARAPTQLGANETASVDVRFTPPRAGAFVDLLVATLDSGKPKVAITLRAISK